MKEIDTQVQEAQIFIKKLDPKKTTLRHIIIEMPKVKDKKRILKAARRKAESYLQRSSHKTISWFLKETLQARRDWQEVFKVMKGKDLQPRLLHPSQPSFRMEGQIKCFPDKEFITTKPLLYERLKWLT